MKLTDEEKQSIEQLIDNPLNALPVYAPFKRLETFYVMVVHDNLHVKIKRSYGAMILEQINLCCILLPKCQFGTVKSKLRATEQFLWAFASILCMVEFVVMHDVGVTVRQATELVMLIKEIQSQMGGFRKYLHQEDNRQNPEPAGEGSEQVFSKGAPTLM